MSDSTQNQRSTFQIATGSEHPTPGNAPVMTGAQVLEQGIPDKGCYILLYEYARFANGDIEIPTGPSNEEYKALLESISVRDTQLGRLELELWEKCGLSDPAAVLFLMNQGTDLLPHITAARDRVDKIPRSPGVWSIFINDDDFSLALYDPDGYPQGGMYVTFRGWYQAGGFVNQYEDRPKQYLYAADWGETPPHQWVEDRGNISQLAESFLLAMGDSTSFTEATLVSKVLEEIDEIAASGIGVDILVNSDYHRNAIKEQLSRLYNESLKQQFFSRILDQINHSDGWALDDLRFFAEECGCQFEIRNTSEKMDIWDKLRQAQTAIQMSDNGDLEVLYHIWDAMATHLMLQPDVPQHDVLLILIHRPEHQTYTWGLEFQNNDPLNDISEVYDTGWDLEEPELSHNLNDSPEIVLEARNCRIIKRGE